MIHTSAESLVADGGTAGNGGSISVQATQRVFASANFNAQASGTGQHGGVVKLLADEVIFYGASVNVSGAGGGGTALVGGDYQGMNPAVPNAISTAINYSTVLRADATQSGDGGKVIVWSDQDTKYAGHISARGGAQSGNGGFIEVSGKENLRFAGTADAGASNGVAGTLLLDPKNITINAAAGGGGVSTFQLVNPHPGANNQFPDTVTALANSNVVLTDPYNDFVASNAGAVYLFNGGTGALISTINGSAADDRVGSSGVVALTGNNNFVVRSPDWSALRGAASWGNGVTGFIGGGGAVSPLNSLVGTTAGDWVSDAGVTVLTNGNYVVSSHYWNNGGGVSNAGAATFGSGTTGISGAVSAANSLVGTTANDFVGLGAAGIGVTALANGNYVVVSRSWNGAAVDVGAVTWGNGLGGTVGAVTVANSLVGTSASDMVGSGSFTALANGNYVVASPFWRNGAANFAGAVTFGSGTAGISGAVSSGNSLVGTTASDFVGNGGVVVLTNGNYVVKSANWDNPSGSVSNVGAVTFGSSTTGVSGAVSSANSLVGTTASDFVGNSGETALSNGNYVVSSSSWDNGGITNADAATWVNGSNGQVSDYAANSNNNIISAANSLVGSQVNDMVGSSVTALTGGNYVVASSSWANGGTAGVGAVTWVNGSNGQVSDYATNGNTNIASTANSLVGSNTGDSVGFGGVFALSNGNYVVASRNWQNGAATQAGAVTFVDPTVTTPGAMGNKVGIVSAANSLVGSTTGDNVGRDGVTELSNGNYVVTSSRWNGAVAQVGAVTFGNGTTGVSGVVSASNSLVGSTAFDNVGNDGVVALPSGNYLVRSTNWKNGSAPLAGAVTWVNGANGHPRNEISPGAVVSANNSLVGSESFDQVGGSGVTVLSSGNYVVNSPGWDGGGRDYGAVTFGSGTTGVSGIVSAANSLVGTQDDGDGMGESVGGGGVMELMNGNYVVLSPNWFNGAALSAGAVTYGSGTTGISGAVSAANSLVGTQAGDRLGSGGATAFANGSVAVRSPDAADGVLTSAGLAHVLVAPSGSVSAFQLVNPHPGAGNLFPAAVTVLSNNNVVAVDRYNDFAATDAGAAFLFNGTTGALISNITGSGANDQVGSWGIKTLTGNNNFVIWSGDWNGLRGAVTWGSGVTGFIGGGGAVSASNSLVGTTANDRVGYYDVKTLSTGNYLVRSPNWINGAATNAGAVTFGSGLTGVAGAVSAANSLVGSSTNDNIGDTVQYLANGSYLVKSSFSWDNGAATNAGAVTFGSGSTGVSGVVSAANSLVGTSSNDNVGSGVTELTNGNYVVQSPFWSNGTVAAVGAVTFASGKTGISGSVSAGNSLVGSTANDRVGSVTALTNGNYVVSSGNWDNGGATNAGAVTWVDGSNGYPMNESSAAAVVSTGNSLYGTTTGDSVGSSGATALANGNYVVSSTFWNFVGAATWGSGTSGVSGAVSAANSLVGSQGDCCNGDRIGNGGITTLANGNYLVLSPLWDNGGTGNAGAVTWGNGLGGTVGTVSSGNSLVGTSFNEKLGEFSSNVRELTSGNYLVLNGKWSNAGNANAGAVTFGSGTSGVSGTISTGNSLVGTAASDRIGWDGVILLSNGNYVVRSSLWDGAAADVGAVTFGNGATGTVGAVSSSNSLVGSTANDQVGSGTFTVLSSDNYLVRTPNWDNGAATNAGAVSFGSGTSGVSGVISATNSLVGSSANDQIGSNVTLLSNGNYLVSASSWDNGGITNVGEVTFGSGTAGVAGVVSAANSLVGTTANDQVGGSITVLSNGNYVVRSHLWDNAGVVDAGAVTFGNGTTGILGTVSAANSLVGTTASDQVGRMGVAALGSGNYAVISSSWDNAAVSNAGAVTFGSGMSGIIGTVSVANSLVGISANDQVGNGGIVTLSNGNFVVRSSDWSNGAATAAGAVTFASGISGLSGAVSPDNSLVGTGANDKVGSGGVTALSNSNYVVNSYNWNNGATTSVGAISFGTGTGVKGAVSSSNSLVGTVSGDQIGSGGISALSNGSVIVRSPNATDRGFASAGLVHVASPGAAPISASGHTFAATLASDVTLTPTSITAITNTGTALVLQANNDITLAANSNITTSASGNGGALTLQAGRNILLNSSITTDNGNFTAIAGDPGANLTYTDAGTPAIAFGSGASLNVGTGTATLAAIGGTFANNSGSATPITTTGRWLAYSTDPASNTLGGMSAGFKRYNCTYAGGCLTAGTSIAGTGNGLLYSVAPVITVTPDAQAVTYGNAGYTSTLSGFIDGDTAAVTSGSATLSVGGATSTGGKPIAGTHELTYTGGFSSTLGYQFQNAAGSINELTVNARALSVTAMGVNKVYDGLTGATVTLSDNRVTGDMVTIGDGSASYLDKNVGMAKIVNVSGIALTGADADNYAFNTTAATSADISARALSITAAGVNKVYDGLTTAVVSLGDNRVAGDVITLGGSARYLDKNVGISKTVNVNGIAVTGADAGNYTFNSTVATSADISARALSITAAGVNKVYDGLTTAVVSLGDNRVAGDVITLGGSARYLDKNVGISKTVNVNGIAVTGADAGNYTFNSTAATSADITVRPLSTWIGGASGNWSLAANWDALPDLSNVTAASLPTGTSVNYDAAAGSTNLASLTAGGLSLAGGNLNIANTLTVNSSFSQSGGTLGFGSGAAASITQARGNLTMPAATLANLNLAAPAGAITQSGAIAATALRTQSQTGTTLTDAGNKIANFTAENTGSGNVSLTNTAVLTLGDIGNTTGNITVDNTGAVTTVGAVKAPAGAVSIRAHSPLSIGTGGVSAGGNITLTAGDAPASTDHLTLDGVIESTGSGTITLFSGDNQVQNANVKTNGGAVNATAQIGNISMALGTTTSTAGGSIGYKASSGNVTLASLDAGSGTIDLSAAGSIKPVSGFAGANLIGSKAVIFAGENANLSTQVKQLDITVEGTFSIADLLTGSVFTDVPAALPVPTDSLPVQDQVLSTINATTQPQPTQYTNQTPPPPPATTFGGSGSQLLSSSMQSIGGKEGTFGGDAGYKPAADKLAAPKPGDDKLAGAKKDDSKANDKKDDDKKKDEDAGPKKQADKPAPKKLATCS